MKTTRGYFLVYALVAFCIVLTLQARASSSVLKSGLGATLVCPFTVINGPKTIGNVVVSCFEAPDSTCNTTPIGNAAWGGRGGTPTLENGSHTLSNDALASVGLTAFPTTVNIQVEVHNPENTVYSLLCMHATVALGVFTCTGGPYTLDISNL
ncbi:MAG: hypothetical protein Q8L78_08700 [Coxiellaceae bacterium]|nr:hypothetical protein [Coxiellaceae bacterium]